MRTKKMLINPSPARTILAGTLAVLLAGCATTSQNTPDTAQAKRATPQGSFDTRCYFAMKAVEASPDAATLAAQSGNSPLTVCTVADDEKSLSFFFFSPGKLGGSTLFTVSLPDYQVLSVKPQK